MSDRFIKFNDEQLDAKRYDVTRLSALTLK